MNKKDLLNTCSEAKNLIETYKVNLKDFPFTEEEISILNTKLGTLDSNISFIQDNIDILTPENSFNLAENLKSNLKDCLNYLFSLALKLKSEITENLKKTFELNLSENDISSLFFFMVGI